MQRPSHSPRHRGPAGTRIVIERYPIRVAVAKVTPCDGENAVGDGTWQVDSKVELEPGDQPTVEERICDRLLVCCEANTRMQKLPTFLEPSALDFREHEA